MFPSDRKQGSGIHSLSKISKFNSSAHLDSCTSLNLLHLKQLKPIFVENIDAAAIE
jgi:hypothetical protein